MFVVDPKPTFSHTVKVQVPVDGGFKDQDFKATFAVVATDDIQNYDLSSGSGTKDFLRAAIVHMSELVDKNNDPISYNDEIRDLLLGQLYVRKALVRTYFDAVSGAQLGN